MAMIGQLGADGRTMVPQEVRDELGLRAGAKVEWRVEGGRAVLVPWGGKRAIDLAGILAHVIDRPSTIEEEDAAMGEAIARHVLGEDKA